MDIKTLVAHIKEDARKSNLGLIFEAKKLSGSGKDAERHANKYVSPLSVPARSNPVEAKSNLSLNSEIRNDKGKVVGNKGSKLVPIQGTTREIGGKHHTDFHVVHADGTYTKATIPHTSVNVESEKTGKHNEEHAVIRAWNHFSEHFDGGTPNLKDMHDEISAAQKDKTHPLHISKVPKSEFAHRLNGHGDEGSAAVRERAEHTYYGNLRDAAHTVHAMANHKDFKTHWKNKDTLEGSGRTQPELSDLYKETGVKGAGATSKADVITVRSRQPGHKALKLISLKKEAGSQLMSSSPAEFEGIYRHALRKHMEAGHITQGEHDTHVKTVQRIRSHLDNGNYEQADKMIQTLHKKLD